MLNFLTFDIEEWYTANYDNYDFSGYLNIETNLEKLVERLLLKCEVHDLKATFFIVGSIAEKKPQIVKKIQACGHEIASHSYSHALIYKMAQSEFMDDLKKSVDILENITGGKVIGYRAPSWSVNENIQEWFYDVLEKNGIKYSSSVYSGTTKIYGFPGFPNKIVNPLINGKKHRIIEIPNPVISFFGKKIGFSGGGYFRLFPYTFIKRNMLKRTEKGNYNLFYLHPREIDPSQPKIELPFFKNKLHYLGISGCERKLDRLLLEFQKSLTSIRDGLSIELKGGFPT